ncbi:MAG: hypothetical protein QGG09_00640 [Pirellulaceae bacterium]|jgi:hypothetical protein|nr:hypothetical protein [Pirellulaceae bacterium]HJN10154.1 hypothetical protein [Pirellulaceae bacterium]
MKLISPMLGLCLSAVCFTEAAADDARLTTASTVQFATVEQGAVLLAKEDRFLKSLSRFDCQARLQTDRKVAGSDVGKFSADQVVAWTGDEQAKLREAVAVVSERMKPFDLPFPSTIRLVKTTGKEEGNAAYCRRNVIVLPERNTKQRPASLQRLLIHELFHVLSSHNPGLRSKLYTIVGFTTCQPIQMPPSLRDRKLTNPDAPQLDAYIKLTVDGQPVTAVPVLYASTEAYDVKRGGTFFDYLTFRLMAVEPVGKRWQPVLFDGQPQLLDPKSTTSFHDQIGKNTGYIIHPDEILADNFVHLVNQTKGLASPEIVVAMRKQLAR